MTDRMKLTEKILKHMSHTFKKTAKNINRMGIKIQDIKLRPKCNLPRRSNN